MPNQSKTNVKKYKYKANAVIEDIRTERSALASAQRKITQHNSFY